MDFPLKFALVSFLLIFRFLTVTLLEVDVNDGGQGRRHEVHRGNEKTRQKKCQELSLLPSVCASVKTRN